MPVMSSAFESAAETFADGVAMRRNTQQRWGSVSIGLHWIIAALVLTIQVPVGLCLEVVDQGPLQDALYFTHKNVGILIFVLAVARLGWRWANPTPTLPSDLPAWQRTAARASHWALYLIIFLMPISGFLLTAAGGYPVPLLGLLDIAPLVARNKPLADAMTAVHGFGQWALYFVATLHLAGALQHHLIRRDDVLRRMLSSRASLG